MAEEIGNREGGRAWGKTREEEDAKDMLVRCNAKRGSERTAVSNGSGWWKSVEPWSEVLVPDQRNEKLEKRPSAVDGVERKEKSLKAVRNVLPLADAILHAEVQMNTLGQLSGHLVARKAGELREVNEERRICDRKEKKGIK